MWVLQDVSGGGYGSACPIYSDGGRTYFITAKHCISTKMSIQLPTKIKPIPAVLVWKHKDLDMAIVSAELENVRCFRIRSRTPKWGEHIYISGYPMNRPLTAFEGLALQPGRASVQVGPGASGGAVQDSQGYLIGIVRAMEPIYTFAGMPCRWGPVMTYVALPPLSTLRRLAAVLPVKAPAAPAAAPRKENP